MRLRNGLSALLAALFVTALSSAALGEFTFYVSPRGRDTNPGTKAKAFATIERARDALRALKSKKGLREGGVTIYLRGGQYNLDKTVLLGPQDSGREDFPITYKAFPGENPFITSAKPIKGWKKLAEDVPGVTQQAKGHLWVARVPRGWRFHYLYVNGEAQPIARTPNHNNWQDWPRPEIVGPPEAKGQLMKFPKGVLDNLPNNGDVEINFLSTWWWNTLSVLRDIDPAAGTAWRHSFSVTLCGNDVKKPEFAAYIGTYQILNALTAIDEPGEWCVNSSEGKVYFWPKIPLDGKASIIAPKLYELVRVQGDEARKAFVHHVSIVGLTFRYTDRLPEDKWPKDWLKRQAECPDAALFLEGVEDCTIAGNTITDVGTYAVALNHYAQRVKVVGNEMGRLGCGGVQCFGYGPGALDVCHHNTISRNYIHDTGLAPYWHSPAVSLYCSGSNEISYNWIERTPYAGISIVSASWQDLNRFRDEIYGTNYSARDTGFIWDSYGSYESIYWARWDDFPKEALTRESAKKYLLSGDNKIVRNVVFNDMRILQDGGALYCWSCGNNNLWSENLIRRVDKDQPAIYMDDWTDYATVEKNIVWVPGGCWRDNTHGNTIKWADTNVKSCPDKPAGFDELLKLICVEAKKLGGWPSSVDTESVLR